jgi:triphosphoribosyl-dephospho-CoA synthase
LPTGLCAQIACIWEATARKPGNVHRHRDFDDLRYTDFLLSAAAIAPVLENAPRQRIGQTVLDCIRATRCVASTNTNLGIVLLLAPLAAVAPDQDVRSGVEAVLAALNGEDSRDVYAAIRLAKPGGLGRVPEEDVHAEPTRPLREIMALAADRDLVARQYADGFREVLDEGVPALLETWKRSGRMESAIIGCQLRLLASHPDSLIARKIGLAAAAEASRRAAQVVAAGWPGVPAAASALAELDAWMCDDSHRRNPGTTADLVTSCLFVALRDGLLSPQQAW